jgi:uncharacterized integral membrane protein (TIGR00698 family)
MTAVAPISHASFADPFFTSSIDSFEGVPDYIAAPEKTPVRATATHNIGHEALAWLAAMLPGFGLAVMLAYIGSIISDFIGVKLLHFKDSPLSPIIVAVVIGLLIRNTIGVPTSYEKGLRLCLRGVLRLGIVLLGLRLGLGDVGVIGLKGLPIIIVTISTALLVVTWLNNRLGLSRRLGVLIAVGTSICGVSAIVATGAAIDAEEDEMSYAVSCITLFGLMCLFVYPFYSHWMFNGDAQLAGIFMGTSIHDVAQTTGAGVMYKQQFPNGGELALNAAVVVKLMRNVMMAILIPFMTVVYRRTEKTTAVKKQRISQFIPMFIIAFLAMVILRSVGDSVVGHQSQIVRDNWKWLISQANAGALWCLILAMAAVGLGTGLAKLKNLGIKPFCVGFTAAILVGGVSTILVKLFASYLH